MDWSDASARYLFARHAAATALRAADPSALLDRICRDAFRTDSPIEAFFAALFAATRNRLLAEGAARYALTLCPQVWVEAPHDRRYRLDFALKPSDEWLAGALGDAHLEIRVGVELDGHAFHERTSEQVIARNRRDRDLAALDWRILHFSGSELHRNPGGVVVEALEAGATALDAAKSALLPSKCPLTTRRSHTA